MRRTTTDPIGCVPSSSSVERALEAARRRVNCLEYLLEIARGIEARLKGEPAEVKQAVSRVEE